MEAIAGTTVLAYTEEEIKILQSQKKQDADQFILNFLKISSPELVELMLPCHCQEHLEH